MLVNDIEDRVFFGDLPKDLAQNMARTYKNHGLVVFVEDHDLYYDMLVCSDMNTFPKIVVRDIDDKLG